MILVRAIKISSLSAYLFKNLIVLFFGLDFLVKLLLVNDSSQLIFFRYLVVPKMIILTLAFFSFKGKMTQLSYTKEVLLVVLFCIGQVIIFSNLDKDNILFNGHYLINTIAGLLFFKVYDTFADKNFVNHHMTQFLVLILIGVATILLGAIFEVRLFRTYFFHASGLRYGYNGIQLYHPESGYLYFIALCLIYFKWAVSKQKHYLYFLIACLLAIFFVGTKKMFFLGLLFLGFILLQNISVAKTLKRTTLFYFIASAIISIYMLSKQVISRQLSLFEGIYQTEGFWTAFLSNRNNLLAEKFLPYISTNWTYLNYITGGPAFSTHRVEMELFDLFLFFGAAGIVIYTKFILKLLNNKNVLITFMSLSLVFAAALSGNLFASLNVMVLWSVAVKFIKTNSTSKQ